MGTKQSIYEKPGTLDYYKWSAEEYVYAKKIWSEIEINPQFHGNACLRGFCETYPHYTKFFTLEPRVPMNFDARTTAKFSVIMETMGYVFLDFVNKSKQLDRFVGYLAMVHKDMRLNEQDMHNFATSLIDYLLQTFPMQMTVQCQEAMSKYINSIIIEISRKMKTFRSYDVIQLDVVPSKLPWGRFKLFTDPLIFGKTKSFWNEWKRQWDERLNEWMAQEADIVELAAIVSRTEEEDSLRPKLDENESKTGILQRKASVLTQKRRISDVSASRLALLSLSKTSDAIEQPPNRSRRRNAHRVDERRQRPARSSQDISKVASSRERRRAQKLAYDASKRPVNATSLRRRLQTSRIIMDHVASETTLKKNDEKTLKQDTKIISKARNTARERRRERVVDLE